MVDLNKRMRLRLKLARRVVIRNVSKQPQLLSPRPAVGQARRGLIRPMGIWIAGVSDFISGAALADRRSVSRASQPEGMALISRQRAG
jgi:hypothetical protein